MMIPTWVTIVPLYILFTKIGWVNSFKPLVVPAFFGDPFDIFLLRQFFRQFPRDLVNVAQGRRSRPSPAYPYRSWCHFPNLSWR